MNYFMYVYQENYLLSWPTWGWLYGFVAHITVTNVQIKPIKVQLNLSTYLCMFTLSTSSVLEVVFCILTAIPPWIHPILSYSHPLWVHLYCLCTVWRGTPDQHQTNSVQLCQELTEALWAQCCIHLFHHLVWHQIRLMVSHSLHRNP